MRRYYITAIKNKGRDAWMVSYPVRESAGGRLRWKRKQNMFWRLEKVDAFLEEQKLEQANICWSFLAGTKGRSAEGSAASQVPGNRGGVQKTRASKQDRRGEKRKWNLRFEQTCPQKSQSGENAQKIVIRQRLGLTPISRV